MGESGLGTLRAQAIADSTVTVNTTDGNVVLTGTARTLQDVDRATALARLVPDVQSVDNEMSLR